MTLHLAQGHDVLLQKLEAYVRGLRQILQNEQGSQQNQQHGVDPPNASLVSPFGAAADQPGSATAAAANGAQPHASAPPQEDWGKLMQALHANVTGQLPAGYLASVRASRKQPSIVLGLGA